MCGYKMAGTSKPDISINAQVLQRLVSGAVCTALYPSWCNVWDTEASTALRLSSSATLKLPYATAIGLSHLWPCIIVGHGCMYGWAI